MAAMDRPAQKQLGAYYTPDEVVASLLKWAVRSKEDRLLDPSCGDGRFIAGHPNCVGIEQDPEAGRMAMARAPWALVHEGDFYAWADVTSERFDCAARFDETKAREPNERFSAASKRRTSAS